MLSGKGFIFHRSHAVIWLGVLVHKGTPEQASWSQLRSFKVLHSSDSFPTETRNSGSEGSRCNLPHDFKHRPKLEWGLGSHFCRSLSGIYTTANYTEVLFYTSQLAVPITRFYQKVRKASYKHRCAFIAMLSMTHSYLWNLTQDPSKILWLYGIIYSELDVLDLSKSKISWIAF